MIILCGDISDIILKTTALEMPLPEVHVKETLRK